jgi:hypothetical protein
MMKRRINWFGLAAGIITLTVVIVSFYIPWWQLTVGDKLLQINASPINTNFGLLDLQFTVPLIWAWNIATILLLVSAGVIMLIYSVFPTKSYAKELLGFSYKKPLYALIGFVAGLLVIISISGLIGFSIPLMGSSTFTVPTQFIPMGLTINALVSGSFQLPFWLAIVATSLCIVARLYHGKVTKIEVAPAAPISPIETQVVS